MHDFAKSVLNDCNLLSNNLKAFYILQATNHMYIKHNGIIIKDARGMS